MPTKEKTQKQRIYEFVKEKGPVTSSAASKSLGIKKTSAATSLARLLCDGLVKIAGSEKSLNGSNVRIYVAVSGESIAPTRLRGGGPKLLLHDERKKVMVADIARLGGGPFGLMAAQLGAGL